MKKVISVVIAVLLVMITAVSVLGAESYYQEVAGSMFKVTTTEDFNAGELEGLQVVEDIGNGAIKLAEGSTDGNFKSAVYKTEAFEYLVASWNADTPAGTEVEVLARVYVDMKGTWSGWISWGKWTKNIRRASTSDEDEIAYIDTDTLTVKGSSGETASLVQVMVKLHSNDVAVSPTVRQVAVTYKNTLEGQAITPLYVEESVELPEKVILDTPAFAQSVREASMGSVMCSATTISVLLNDRGEDILPEESALIDYDYAYEGFGNWSYSVAAAGAHGYEAYVQYASFDILRQELARGYSVGLSVKYSNEPTGSNPYLEGAPCSTSGHLITITGYETIDGVEYFYSSDSAAASDKLCRLRYRADQLDACWSNRVAYIVHDKESNVQACSPMRVAAELVAVEGEEYVYDLCVDGQKIEFPKNFSSTKYKVPGAGLLTYFIEEKGAQDMGENIKVKTGNNLMYYNITMNNEGRIKIDPTKVLPDKTQPATVHLFVVVNDGTTYEAVIKLDAIEAAVTEEPTSEPTAEPTVEPTAEPAVEASDEPVTDTEPNEKEKSPVGWIIGGVAAVIAIVIAVVAVGRKKK